jgi:hypothetical protein
MTSLEKYANIAIIIACVVAVGTIVDRFYIESAKAKPAKPLLNGSGREAALVGKEVRLPNIHFGPHRSNLVLVLSTRCRYCAMAMDLYRSLVNLRGRTPKDLRIIAVFPQDPAEVRDYLSQENIAFDELRYSPLDALPTTSTPTMLLVDGAGKVTRAWIGAPLDEGYRREVFAAVKSACSACL